MAVPVSVATTWSFSLTLALYLSTALPLSLSPDEPLVPSLFAFQFLSSFSIFLSFPLSTFAAGLALPQIEVRGLERESWDGNNNDEYINHEINLEARFCLHVCDV